MNRDVYRYTFNERVPASEIRDTLFLALFATEDVHGRTQVRLDAGFQLDEKKRACVVDAGTPVGQTMARIFTGLMARQFGDDAFHVERVSGPPQPPVGSTPEGGAR